MANLPGNPYVDMPSNYEAGEVSNAILALAYEMRTLSLATLGASEQIGAMSARSEARERLGL